MTPQTLLSKIVFVIMALAIALAVVTVPTAQSYGAVWSNAQWATQVRVAEQLEELNGRVQSLVFQRDQLIEKGAPHELIEGLNEAIATLEESKSTLHEHIHLICANRAC